ncbi:4-diphosphocytidyl-2C-methyl-D-erythritol synthase [Streptomyces sp. WAC 06738]|uniref:nucleotidyltransferase family protein n=1 Tax=Streptomyces sp. WAC 06738 TaxID=2203210 RepID=UPI000F6FB045|nr:NTP transferase domain-containing protein [Streptomyces sp. WAC 06738]AZM49489.1 4-diphosphocytidyl-2C-methyl-D-erythritol synthase [Streptomyces sp. WAC 06738]
MSAATGPSGSGPAVAGLLLAAGGGRRLGGRPKALLPAGPAGRPLVERAAGVLRAAGCAPVHVVLGAAEEAVRAGARLAGCVPVSNPDWESGMGSSLRAGLASLEPTAAAAVVVLLVDQPRVGPAAVARVVAAYAAGGAELAAATYDGVRGHPVLLGRPRWPEAAAGATGDRGARDVLASAARRGELALVECGDVAAPDDVDTPADLALLDEPRAGWH